MAIIVGEVVKTPYGYGTIIDETEKHFTIEPLNWRLASSVFLFLFLFSFLFFFHSFPFFSDQKPTFYIRKEDVSHYYKVGDCVRTVYGTGVIKHIREEDGIHIVILNNWKLANNTSPTLYLQANSLTKEVTSLFFFFFFSVILLNLLRILFL